VPHDPTGHAMAEVTSLPLQGRGHVTRSIGSAPLRDRHVEFSSCRACDVVRSAGGVAVLLTSPEPTADSLLGPCSPAG
jgi:hypothetical protein